MSEVGILKYIFLAAFVLGGLGAVRKWQARRRQMRQIRGDLARKRLP